MALISCPECGKEISDQAVTCPHCGYGLKKEKVKQKTTLGSGNLSSKITATNALAIIMQISLVVLLFVNLIKVTILEGDVFDDGTLIKDKSFTKLYSIATLSFKNVTKYLDNKLSSGKSDIIRGGFSGAQVGFIILIILFTVVLAMMIFEFVKSKLLFNAIINEILVVITAIYAICFCNYLTHISGLLSVSGTVAGTGKPFTIGYEFSASGLATKYVFIILCIVVCLIKAINYWLHHDNKTETIKTFSFKKRVDNSDNLNEGTN